MSVLEKLKKATKRAKRDHADGPGFAFEPVQSYPEEETAPRLHEVAEMCGWAEGRNGHDAMEGVDALVMDGGPDAMRYLDTESATEGGPLELADDETIFSDDTGRGDMGGEYEW